MKKRYRYYFAYLNKEFIGIARTRGEWMEVEAIDPKKNAEFNFRVIGLKKGFTLEYKSSYIS